MSYCEGVLLAVERRAAGRPVARIGVRIGAVHRVVAAAFEQSFQIAAAGGPAADATTEVVVVPVLGHCMDCRHDFDEHRAPRPPARPADRSTSRRPGGDEVVARVAAVRRPGGEAAAAPDRTLELVPAHTHAPGEVR